MSEEETKTFRTDREVLDQVLIKIEAMDSRLQRVESKIQERGFDTKPIWEKALAAIMEVKDELSMVNRKIALFSDDLYAVRAEQSKTEERLRRLESEEEGGRMMRVN
ncbi:MAG TPA: hypothetical protein VJU84_01230 [Pyrinomonadaceae bacterium]|nr:hypothetical protein [Pyrinomonadaceae bacterium]